MVASYRFRVCSRLFLPWDYFLFARINREQLGSWGGKTKDHFRYTDLSGVIPRLVICPFLAIELYSSSDGPHP
jgi:hypothetical protein